jgi:hypothetical protein
MSRCGDLQWYDIHTDLHEPMMISVHHIDARDRIRGRTEGRTNVRALAAQ